MKRGESGFSLLELMIALAIVGAVLAAASTFFIGVVRQYKVQTKITESNVEGVIGLELLRQDIESLGFGLPWNNLVNYTERTGVITELLVLNDSPSNAPRAVVSLDCTTLGINNGSAYLVVKSARVGMNAAAGKWTTLRGPAAPVIRTWGSSEEDLAQGDRVIVLSPGSATTDPRVLLTPVGGSAFGVAGAGLSAYTPNDTFNTNIVYGIDNATLQRPFNRADYYIADNSAYPTPRQCASNTGVLVKAAVAHDTNGTATLFPLLDCVADLRVVYGVDTDGDGVLEWQSFPPATAADLRTQLRELRVHILAQVGQRDVSYTYPQDNVYVGSEGVGRSFDVSGYRDFRWKQYNIVVRPLNLAN